MRITNRIGLLALTAAGGLALTACGTAAPPVVPVELSSGTGITTSPLPPGASTGPAAPAPAPAGEGPAGGPVPSQVVPIDGEYEVVAGDAATARFAVDAGLVTLVDLQVAQGWQQVGDERDRDEVELTFLRDTTRVELDVEVDDGRFETDVDIDSIAADARISYPVAEAGTVTVDVVGDFVALVDQEAAAGWVATINEPELADGEVEIQFRNDAESRSVSFDADIDDGDLNVDIDTRTGTGHAERGPGR